MKIMYTTACKPHLLYGPHYEKTAFCLREKHTEEADQLCVNRTADQILCFRDIDSRIPKLAKFEISRYAVRFLMDLFGNTNNAFFSRRGSSKSGVKGVHITWICMQQCICFGREGRSWDRRTQVISL